MHIHRILMILFFVATCATSVPAVEERILTTPWFDARGSAGPLAIVGGGETPEPILDRYRKIAADSKAVLIVITDASSEPQATFEREAKFWKEIGFQTVEQLQVGSWEEANDEKLIAKVKSASAFWISGGDQKLLAAHYCDTKLLETIKDAWRSGVLIGGTSAGAAIMSNPMIAAGNPIPEISEGFGLVENIIIDQHFTERNRLPRLQKGIQDRLLDRGLSGNGTDSAELYGMVGLGIDESTALLIDGRDITVHGKGKVSLVIPEGAGRPAETKTLGDSERLDLVSLRRLAWDRQSAPFPASGVKPTLVPAGSLLIVGGGGMDRSLVEKFIELAGGPEAKIVALPTASPPSPRDRFEGEFFRRAGAKNVTALPQRRREDIESDEVLNALKEANGVWFGGGRQWNFMDCYAGTKAEPLFHEVLARGGVIGGSSAGASIQAEYMVRGSPHGNMEMMAPGYERGLGFLPGAAVDQHFSQRNRLQDLVGVVDRFPQLLGIGIDEATAIVVRKNQAEVFGPGKVFFLHRGEKGDLEKTQVDSLPAGSQYDLVERKPL